MTDAGHGSDGDARPEWWTRNQRLRDELDLPAYEPSRLSDGTYVHEVVDSLEERYECSITLRSKNPRHPCDWRVLVDGEPVVTVERTRTEQGNTIYQLTSEELETAVRSACDST